MLTSTQALGTPVKSEPVSADLEKRLGLLSDWLSDQVLRLRAQNDTWLGSLNEPAEIVGAPVQITPVTAGRLRKAISDLESLAARLEEEVSRSCQI